MAAERKRDDTPSKIRSNAAKHHLETGLLLLRASSTQVLLRRVPDATLVERPQETMQDDDEGGRRGAVLRGRQRRDRRERRRRRVRGRGDAAGRGVLHLRVFHQQPAVVARRHRARLRVPRDRGPRAREVPRGASAVRGGRPGAARGRALATMGLLRALRPEVPRRRRRRARLGVLARVRAAPKSPASKKSATSTDDPRRGRGAVATCIRGRPPPNKLAGTARGPRTTSTAAAP